MECDIIKLCELTIYLQGEVEETKSFQVNASLFIDRWFYLLFCVLKML